MKISILSFSSRPNGNCAQISSYLKELHGEEAEVYRFSDFEIAGCGRCNHECFAGQECPHIKDMEYTLQDAVTNSDLCYFVVPNYCGYPCSNFFIFNERCVCYTKGIKERSEAYKNSRKKFIIVSNSGQENFRKLMGYHCNGEPDMLYLESRKYGSPLMANDDAKAEVKAFAEK